MAAAKSTSQQRPEHRPMGTGGSLRQRLLRRRDRSEIGVCTKYTLFFENFIMFIVGLALMAMGTYILVLKEKTVHDAIDFFLDPACDMCLAGSLVFALAFFGCMGSLRENTAFLKIFYYSLTIFLLLEVGLTVCFFLAYYLPNVRNVIFPDNLFKQAIVSYRDDNDMRDLIDNIQSSLGCCGQTDSEKGYEDWNQNPYFNCSLQNESPERCSVPPSCCRIQPGSNINLLCGANIYTLEKDGQMTLEDTSKIYTDGCLKALRVWVNDNMLILAGVMAGILLPQIFIICLTRSLLDMIRSQKDKWRR